MVETLSLRRLNRATLGRQMLLRRERTTALRAVERLVGLQAQQARPPFLGLWSRVENLRREDLLRLVRSRRVVRAVAMRVTLHLMSAKDFLSFRAALQPALSDGMRTILRGRAEGLDIPRLAEEARAFLAEGPRIFEDLRDHLGRLHSGADVRAMGYAVRTHLPLVQVPGEGERWGWSGQALFAAAEEFLGKSVGREGRPHALLLRYLAAFGPATPADAQAWSGLPGLREVFEDLRPRLRAFRDERGRDLFDLPKAPRPPEDTSAPPRFLPDFDNLVLSHADRTRVVADEHRPRVVTRNLQVLPTFIVDGFVAGTWRVERRGSAATLRLAPFGRLSKEARGALAEEGLRLLRFVEEDADDFDVR